MKRVLNFPPIRFVTDVGKLYFRRRISRAAAELAYFLILTFFPILICLSAFLDKLNLNLTSFLDEASHFIPQDVILIFQEYLNYLDNVQSTGMLVLGLFMTVLFASAAVRGLMNIMHEIYGRATFYGLRQIVASVLFAVLLLVTIYLALAVVLTGNWFFTLLRETLEVENLVHLFRTWQWVKYILLLALVFLFVLLLYRFTAPLDKPRPPVFPGALAATFALAGASVLFSTIMGGPTQYSLVYGSLTSVVLLLVWLFLCGNIFILGCVVNYVIYVRRKEKKALK